MRTIIRTLLVLSLTLTGSNWLLAQATATGSIIGVVSDATGAALPATKVTVTDLGTNAQRTTTSGSAGQYRFDFLPAGAYRVKGESAGFSSAEVKDIQLLVGTTFTANLPMRAGIVNSSIEVVANNQLVDTEKTDSSASVTPKEIVDLPLNGRDIANLAILAPGVKLVDSYDPTKNRYAI
ncbi:MAG: carboxypeptidase-like regulatory domain-containing protein, partial [Edaphobacter sp.]